LSIEKEADDEEEEVEGREKVASCCWCCWCCIFLLETLNRFRGKAFNSAFSELDLKDAEQKGRIGDDEDAKVEFVSDDDDDADPVVFADETKTKVEQQQIFLTPIPLPSSDSITS